MPKQLEFDLSIQGTQPIVRLAWRCPPRQTAGLPTAKQAAPSSPPWATWGLFQRIIDAIKF
jgi:hypothetical protein